MMGDMYPAGGGGWIEVVCGVMFSGKSEELIRRVRRALIAKKRVQVRTLRQDVCCTMKVIVAQWISQKTPTTGAGWTARR